jgi:hypothetical protein
MVSELVVDILDSRRVSLQVADVFLWGLKGNEEKLVQYVGQTASTMRSCEENNAANRVQNFAVLRIRVSKYECLAFKSIIHA